MANTVGVNGLSVVHAGSGGTVVASPDTCLTPSQNGSDPIVYTNIAASSNATAVSSTVKCEGNGICIASSSFSKSSGDESGTSGGVTSGTTQGRAIFTNYSFNVTIEGQAVARATDLMISNSSNTPTSSLLQGPVVAVAAPALPGQRKCVVCGEPF